VSGPPPPPKRPGLSPEMKVFGPIYILFSFVVAVIVFFTVTLPWIRRGNEKAARVPREEQVDEQRPAYGEYVWVEEFPEPLTKVTPNYPAQAQEAGIEGNVVVQALVGRTGRVLETRIVKSDPHFDQAAEDAVRQYTFKPAKADGKPIAVWVAVPIRFVLN